MVKKLPTILSIITTQEAATRVLVSLVGRISDYNCPPDQLVPLLAEFRLLLPVAVDASKVKDLETANINLAERVLKLEQQTSAVLGHVDTLLDMNGVKVPTDFERF